MDETLINNWNKVVDKEDVVFHLGDFAVGGAASWSNLLQRLNGKVYLIMGNHDVHTIDKGFEGFQYVSWEMLIKSASRRFTSTTILLYASVVPTRRPGNSSAMFTQVPTSKVKIAQGSPYSSLLNMTWE
jgi:calcineurin-like phosphoesterase family protein